jgi:hypothetical protein
MVRSSDDRLPQGDSMTSLKEHIRNIEKAVKKHKKQNKGQRFTLIPPDEIEKRLKRANTPIIYGFGYTDLVRPGQTIHCSFDIYNPGPDRFGPLAVHVWVGFHIVDATGGPFLLDVDKRFPRLTQPRYGLSVDSDSSVRLGGFPLAIPTTVEKTVYVLNACLVQGVWNYYKFLDSAFVTFEVVA